MCTHNSARSQMGEGWLRHWLKEVGLDAEVFSAGTQVTRVKLEAIEAMAEVGIDLSAHTSKTLYDLPDPWNFDLVITVCDSAAENCPVYPAQTQRIHTSFADPSGKEMAEWRKVRDALGRMIQLLVRELRQGHIPSEKALLEAAERVVT